MGGRKCNGQAFSWGCHGQPDWPFAWFAREDDCGLRTEPNEEAGLQTMRPQDQLPSTIGD